MGGAMQIIHFCPSSQNVQNQNSWFMTPINPIIIDCLFLQVIFYFTELQSLILSLHPDDLHLQNLVYALRWFVCNLSFESTIAYIQSGVNHVNKTYSKDTV